jgi:hypothetical protein
MNNRVREAIYIILASEILLIAYSLLINNFDIPVLSSNLKIMPLRKIFDFEQTNHNKTADSLLTKYLLDTTQNEKIFKRTSLSIIGPKKQNLFLTNPNSEGKTPLDNFFKAMLAQKDSCVVRIAHYGDSQLEGDRMSWIVRKKFHEKFGGSGLGYVPLKDLTPISYIRKSSGNWAKHTVFKDRSSKNNYGISGAVFRFGKYAVHQSDEDSASKGESENANAINKSSVKGPYSNATVVVQTTEKYSYHNISVLYGNSESNCIMNLYDIKSGEKVFSDTLPPSLDANMIKHTVSSPIYNLKIEFISDNSPDFYGIYLDDKSGVQVDNYAIRGHSGDGLMMIKDDQLGKMIKLLNTKLVIFQYGANVVPYVKSEKACEWLEDLYYKLFMKFRRAAPDISILVIGSGDMAYENEGEYKSYSYLPKINQAERNAALKSGCAYLDLFNLMGGLNSILVWTEKRLAVTNGHFSNKGQEIIANELVNSLLIEYNMYLHKQRKQKSL